MWWCQWPCYDWDKHGANMIHIVIVIVMMITIMVMMMMMKIIAMTWLLMVGTWCCEYDSNCHGNSDDDDDDEYYGNDLTISGRNMVLRI